MTDDTDTPAKITTLPRKHREQPEGAAETTELSLKAQMLDSMSLPSEHLDHTATFANELTNRIHGFESGVAALEGVLAGKQTAWDTEKAELVRRIDNLKTALRMAKSGVAAKDVPT